MNYATESSCPWEFRAYSVPSSYHGSHLKTMNSSLSMLLRPSPHRILKIFTKMMTTQTHTLQLVDPSKYTATVPKKDPNLPPFRIEWELTPALLMDLLLA